MGKNNNIIVINGKSYDAQTGALLSDESSHKPLTVSTRQPAKHTTSRKTQRSNTLMRHTLRKSPDSLKRHIKAQSGKGVVAKHTNTAVITKLSVHKLDDNRLKNSKKVPKSKLITKFVPTSAGPSLTHSVTSVTSHTIKPAEISSLHHPKQPKTTADLLQQALERATSHEQTYSPPKKRLGMTKTLASISAVSAAMVVILVVFTSHGLSTVRLHFASSKAGFSVNTPSYQPAGYDLSHITYSAGSAGLHFTSNSDDRAFSITEQVSNWDVTTLQDLVVTPSTQEYQTIQSAGRTIFMTNNRDATWVDKGILYQVDTEGALNEQQLIKIANSL